MKKIMLLAGAVMLTASAASAYDQLPTSTHYEYAGNQGCLIAIPVDASNGSVSVKSNSDLSVWSVSFRDDDFLDYTEGYYNTKLTMNNPIKATGAIITEGYLEGNTLTVNVSAASADAIAVNTDVRVDLDGYAKYHDLTSVNGAILEVSECF